MTEDSFHTLKRYRLLILLVFLLLVLGLGYWLMKKHSPNNADARKNGVLRKLHRHNK